MATLLALTMLADVVTLKSGGRLEGVVVERKDGRIVLELPAGTVTLRDEEVQEVVEGPCALSEFRDRLAALGAAPEPGKLADLAAWAREKGLSKQAHGLWGRVLEAEPDHEAARRALGHEQVDGRWMTRDEAMKARGFVRFEGSWIRAEDRDLILAVREKERLDRLEARRIERERRAAEKREREEAAAPVEVPVVVPSWWDKKFWHARVGPGVVVPSTLGALWPGLGTWAPGPPGYVAKPPPSGWAKHPLKSGP